MDFAFPSEMDPSGLARIVRCACDRLHALCEDLFAGKTDEQHFHFAVSLAVECECGRVIRTHLLQKFKML
jgi:hypothetical protein